MAGNGREYLNRVIDTVNRAEQKSRCRLPGLGRPTESFTTAVTVLVDDIPRMAVQ